MTSHATAVTYHPWSTFIAARAEALRKGDRRLGADHLLLGILHDFSVVDLLGVSPKMAHAQSTQLDNSALEAIGLTSALTVLSVHLLH